MRPRVLRVDGREIAPAVTVVLVETEPEDATATFRHAVRRTHDPERRLKDALTMLASAYYQYPGDFSDRLTALFARPSALADSLIDAGDCVLEFAQFNQRYRIVGAIKELASDDPAFQATFWHNHMFNPAMPRAVHVLAFVPDWSASLADPPV